MHTYPNTFIDQLHREVVLTQQPKRIISLVPSQTALLHYLGLDDEVVGITKFCIHPDIWFKCKTRIGGTKQFNYVKIDELQPDLIIANKEENDKDALAPLMQQYPVWISDIYNLGDALHMIDCVGQLANKTIEAINLTKGINNAFAQLKPYTGNKPKNVLYVIWHEPLMVAGANTFIDSMLQQCGFVNAANMRQRYSTLENKKYDVDIVMLSSEPFPFSNKHIPKYQQLFPDAKILLVNGEAYSWYGSHLLNAPLYFNQLIEKL
jgi:ABC-type Fe3+-hydroxamate transport system substrate-binding protein